MPGPWQRLGGLGATLDLGALERYAVELERWNRAIRLVGPRGLEGIRAQIIDALLPFLLHPPAFPLLDIGSGAGLPGIPLAIAFPGAAVVCLEPQGKRVSFLRHAVRCLGLKGVDIVAARAEDALAGAPELAGAFGTVTGRGVAEPGVFLALAEPFLGECGRAMLLRAEEGAPPVAGWLLCEEASYRGPEGLGPRSFAVYERARPEGGAR